MKNNMTGIIYFKHTGSGAASNFSNAICPINKLISYDKDTTCHSSISADNICYFPDGCKFNDDGTVTSKGSYIGPVPAALLNKGQISQPEYPGKIPAELLKEYCENANNLSLFNITTHWEFTDELYYS